MNISFLVLNIFTALLGSLSFSLSNLVGEGWAVSVHGAHVITNLWMIGVLFSDKIPGRTIMLISGAQTLADASSAFLGLIFFSRCVSSEVGACFDRLWQSALVFLLGTLLSILGILKLLSAREFDQKEDEEGTRRRRHLIMHLLSLPPYVFYLILGLEGPLLFLPMLRGIFIVVCIASRWGFSGDNEFYEKWSAILGLIFSALSLFEEYGEEWKNSERFACIWFFVLFDFIHINLLQFEKRKDD